MDVSDVMQIIAERYGLLPVYALVVGWGALQAGGVRPLVTMLGIMAGVYVAMFRAFDLKADLDVLGLAERFHVHPDVANGVAAVLFVFVLGFAVYGAKRLILRRPRED